MFKCQSNFFFFSGDLSLWCALCIVVHRETISFKKTIQGSFSHLILKIFAKKVLYLWWKQLVFSISGLDYAFLHQIFKTGLIGFQKLMGYFGEAYVNIFNEIEISCNINFSIQPKNSLLCYVFLNFYFEVSWGRYESKCVWKNHQSINPDNIFPRISHLHCPQGRW